MRRLRGLIAWIVALLVSQIERYLSAINPIWLTLEWTHIW